MVVSLLPAVSADRNTDYLAAAEMAVRGYCGWHIAPVVTETLTIDGSGTGTLFVPSLRVTSITSVTNDGTDVDVASLEWSANGYLRVPGVWTGKLRGVSLTITHGFDAVPDVAEIVRAVADRAGASPAGVVREQAGGVSLQYSATAPGVSGGVVLMAHERAMLDRYRLPRWA